MNVPSNAPNIYYKQLTSGKTRMMAFPEGFKMLAGDSSLRTFNASSRAQRAIQWTCFDGLNQEVWSNNLPNMKCPLSLRAQIVFPSCWNGKDLDSADHRSHMAYPSDVYKGICDDPNYPVRTITIQYEISYAVGDFAGMWYGSQSPFVLANGDPTGYGMHGDFLNGWDVPTLQAAVDQCTTIDTSPGLIEQCKPLTLSTSSTQQCVKTPTYSEATTGLLDSLPGCNPVWNGVGTKPACPNSLAVQQASNVVAGWSPKPAAASHPTAAIATMKAPATHKNWTYLGCFQDTSARVFPQSYTPPIPISLEFCMDLCQGAGYTFAAAEYGSQCFCGINMTATALPSSSCNMPCPGNLSEPCGQSMRLTAYQLQNGTVISNKLNPTAAIGTSTAAKSTSSTSTRLSSTSSLSVTTKSSSKAIATTSSKPITTKSSTKASSTTTATGIPNNRVAIYPVATSPTTLSSTASPTSSASLATTAPGRHMITPVSQSTVSGSTASARSRVNISI